MSTVKNSIFKTYNFSNQSKHETEINQKNDNLNFNKRSFSSKNKFLSENYNNNYFKLLNNKKSPLLTYFKHNNNDLKRISSKKKIYKEVISKEYVLVDKIIRENMNKISKGTKINSFKNDFVFNVLISNGILMMFRIHNSFSIRDTMLKKYYNMISD